TKNDITYMTQIQLLFDQEKKSTKPGDVELLKRVIRGEEGTFTGYIRGLEGIEAPVVEDAPAQTFNAFNSAANLNSSVETTTTLN
ncbi:hypothetical protein ABMA71_11560, partial [Halobacteriovorax sp. ZH3_bin.1]